MLFVILASRDSGSAGSVDRLSLACHLILSQAVLVIPRIGGAVN